MADFNQFFQLLLLANPQMTNNFQMGYMGNMMNTNMPINNMNMNMMIPMMTRMMGINGTNPVNLISMFNPPPKPPSQVYQNKINLFFWQTNNNIRYTVQTSYKENISFIVNKYIIKSGDPNSNIYILNGKRLDMNKTVGDYELIDNSVIYVVLLMILRELSLINNNNIHIF